MNLLRRITVALSALSGRMPSPRVRLVHRPASYEAGRVSRMDADFMPAGLGPNALADETIELARKRSAYLCDNHPAIAGAMTTVVHNVIGQDGIGVVPNTGDEALNTALLDLYWRHCGGVDAARGTHLSDSQRLFVSELFRYGESLVHFPVAPAYNGAAFGPAIEIIDTDRMPVAGWFLAKGNVRQCVEVDSLGRVAAYHVMTGHPRDNSMAPHEYIRVPSSEANLAFRWDRRRPGQLRGVPWTVTIVSPIRMQQGFTDAAMAQAELAASMGAVWTGDANGSPLPTSDSDAMFTDSSGNPVSRIEPGMIGVVRGKGELKITNTNLPGPNFQASIEAMLRFVAAGLGISYSSLARDYSKATFSATRAEVLEDRRGYASIQQMVWEKHTLPWWRRMVRHWVMTGVLTLSAEQRAAWVRDPAWLEQADAAYPGWDWVNPQQDATAVEIELNSGVIDPYTACARRGLHFPDVLRQRLKAEKLENEMRRSMGLPDRAGARATQARRDQNIDNNGNTVDPAADVVPVQEPST